MSTIEIGPRPIDPTIAHAEQPAKSVVVGIYSEPNGKKQGKYGGVGGSTWGDFAAECFLGKHVQPIKSGEYLRTYFRENILRPAQEYSDPKFDSWWTNLFETDRELSIRLNREADRHIVNQVNEYLQYYPVVPVESKMFYILQLVADRIPDYPKATAPVIGVGINANETVSIARLHDREIKEIEKQSRKEPTDVRRAGYLATHKPRTLHEIEKARCDRFKKDAEHIEAIYPQLKQAGYPYTPETLRGIANVTIDNSDPIDMTRPRDYINQLVTVICSAAPSLCPTLLDALSSR